MSFFDRMKQGASEAARKVEQTVEITKLKARVSSKEKEMDKLFQQVGEAVFHAYIEGDISASETEVMERCAELVGLQAEIEAVNEKIKNIKLEKSCAGCGKVVPVNVRFCPECGKRFPEEEQKQETTIGEIRVICGRCHSENEIGARYCVECGDELSTIEPERTP